MICELIYDVPLHNTHTRSRGSILFWMEKDSIHTYEKFKRQWIELQKIYIVIHYWQQIYFNDFCNAYFLKFKTAPYFHHMNKFKIYCAAATSYIVSKYMLLYCKAAIASSKVVSYLLRTLFSIYTFIIFRICLHKHITFTSISKTNTETFNDLSSP